MRASKVCRMTMKGANETMTGTKRSEKMKTTAIAAKSVDRRIIFRNRVRQGKKLWRARLTVVNVDETMLIVSGLPTEGESNYCESQTVVIFPTEFENLT